MSETARRRIRIAMVIVPVLLAVFVAWNARTALFPFVLGVAIAYVIAPAVTSIAAFMPMRQTRPYLARGLAILILYASVAGLGVGVGFALVPDAVNEVQQFSDDLPDTVERARGQIVEWCVDSFPSQYRQECEEEWLQDAGNAFSDWAVGLAPDALEFAGDTFTILIGYLTIPVWLYFTLKDHPRGVRSFIGMFPPEWRHDVRNAIGIGDATFRNYIRAMLMQAIIIGVMAYFALRVLNVDYPIGLAIIAGFTEMIPIIGPIVGAVPAILVALADDPIKALWVALAFLIIQQIENNLIVPKIQGDFLRLHPGVIIMLLVVGGAITGSIVLLILIVPAAALVRDLYQYAYLRVGNVPPDEALDRSLGEYGAGALRVRWLLEEIVPADELGNRGLGVEYPMAHAPPMPGEAADPVPGEPADPDEPADSTPGEPADPGEPGEGAAGAQVGGGQS